MRKLIFTFGRMQPYTVAHYHLNKFVRDLAQQQSCQHLIGISRTQNHDNPLSWDEKCRLVIDSLPGITICTDPVMVTPIKIVEYYSTVLKYDDITLVVGSDRVENFLSVVNKYKEQWGIKNFNVINFGDRDTGQFKNVSGTVARNFAKENKFNEFHQMLAPSINKSTAKLLFKRFKNENKNNQQTVS